MPVSSTGVNVKYTTDQEIGYLMESAEVDHCVDFLGFVQEVHGRVPVTVQGKKKELYKFIISNGSKRLTVLIWDSQKYEKLSTEFQPDKIVHLDGCEGQVVPMRDKLVQDKILNYELRIQIDSIVEMGFGFHVHTKPVATIVPTIGFLDIAKASGEFKVQAYIKTVMVPARNKDGILGFGTGAITEGKHKVLIKVNAFKKGDADHLCKGMCVLVTGTVKHTGRLTVVCQDISCVEVVADEMKLKEEEVNGANIPLKRCSEDVENKSPNAKKFMTGGLQEEEK